MCLLFFVEQSGKSALSNRSNIMTSASRSNRPVALKKLTFSTPAGKIPFKLNFSFDNSFEKMEKMEKSHKPLTLVANENERPNSQNSDNSFHLIEDAESSSYGSQPLPMPMIRKNIFANHLMHSTPKRNFFLSKYSCFYVKKMTIIIIFRYLFD
jgi:hypothetical protein